MLVKSVAVGKLSGAVGTYSNIDPFVEQYVCEKLGLEPVKIATQVVQRDRHAELLSTIAVVGVHWIKSLWKSAICNVQKCAKRKNISALNKRVLLRCLINVIRLHVKEFAVWLACFVAMLNLLTKTKLVA